MSNSSLVNYTLISPHKNSPRNNSIKKITIHHMAGNLSVERCGSVFQSREASANYGIGSDGRVGMYVEEKDRSWASSSPSNDNQAVTIEVANDGGAPDWHVSDAALKKTIELCADICRRNGISRLNYTGDSSGNLTRHNMFVATTCPGPYLQSKLPYIADSVNAILDGRAAPTPVPVTDLGEITYQVWDDVTHTWLPNVADNSDYAGIFGCDVDCIYANVKGGDMFYRVSTIKNGWLPEVKNRTDYAGIYNEPIDRFSARITLANKVLNYQAHIRGGGWLPVVTGCDINDSNNGYAGVKGQPIDAIRMWLTDKPVVNTEPAKPEPTPEPEKPAEPEKAEEPISEPTPEPTPAVEEPKQEPVTEPGPEPIQETPSEPVQSGPEKENVTTVTDTETKEDTNVKKINWKQKLTSRKMWLSIASFVSMLVLAFGGKQETATQVTSLIVAGASIIAYIAGEGFIDAARNSTSEKSEEDK